jgi:hypothetical protein
MVNFINTQPLLSKNWSWHFETSLHAIHLFCHNEWMIYGIRLLERRSSFPLQISIAVLKGCLWGDVGCVSVMATYRLAYRTRFPAVARHPLHNLVCFGWCVMIWPAIFYSAQMLQICRYISHQSFQPAWIGFRCSYMLKLLWFTLFWKWMLCSVMVMHWRFRWT